MFDKMQKKLDEVLTLVKDDLTQIKTGRAKPAMVETVQVEAYAGQRMPLMELASITAPDPHMLMVSPWDKSVIGAIEKALSASDQNLNPVVDGEIIRISVPALTGERREQLVKMVKQRVESGRQMMRGVRNDEKRDIDGSKGEAGVSEDDIARQLEEMQKVFEAAMKRLDELGEAKETELMEM